MHASVYLRGNVAEIPLSINQRPEIFIVGFRGVVRELVGQVVQHDT